MALPPDVCVRGGGIVGRALALLLARERLRVALVAGPVPAAEQDVRAYALNAPSRELLESLRCWPAGAAVTPVTRMQVHGDDGGVVIFDAGECGAEALTWIVDVPPLQAGLEEAVRYQPLVELHAQAQPAALTVVCEGRSSNTRESLAAGFEALPYRQMALAARVRCAQPHGQVARQWFSEGEVLAFLPLEGPQGNLVAIVWSVSPERAAQLRSMDDEAFAAEVSQASRQTLGPVTLASTRGLWPLQKAAARHWSGSGPQGAWVLAGDAAHTVHPLTGQGLNLGLADAMELARVLREREYWRGVGDSKLLRRYERARKADMAAIGAATDGLQQLFRPGEGPLKALRNWGMNGFDRAAALKTWTARRAMGL